MPPFSNIIRWRVGSAGNCLLARHSPQSCRRSAGAAGPSLSDTAMRVCGDRFILYPSTCRRWCSLPTRRNTGVLTGDAWMSASRRRRRVIAPLVGKRSFMLSRKTSTPRPQGDDAGVYRRMVAEQTRL